MSEKFWIDEPNEIIKNSNIWPMANQDKISKFNSISRLIILLTLFGFFITRSLSLLLSGIVTLVIIIFMYYYKNDDEKKEHVSESFINPENYTQSTPDNPLSNIQLPEIKDDPHRKPAPDAFGKENEEIINEMTKKMVVDNSFEGDETIKKKLFKDLGDEIEFDRSMRNFYSTPNTKIPNDQEGFAKFCYGDMPTCKEGDPLACEKLAFKYLPS